MNYRLIAIDLDGTILNHEGTLIPTARRVILQAIDSGMMVTLATGRMYQSTDLFARELGISIPLICYEGALIQEPNNRNILWHKPLPLLTAQKIIQAVRQLGMHQYVYVEDKMYVEEIIEKDIGYAQRNVVELNLVENLTTFLKSKPTEIAVRGTPAEIDYLISHLSDTLGSSILITRVHSAFCEIGHYACGKGNALKYLANLLGIEQQQTVAIGNGPNDISMLKWAGLGIVTGTAPAEVMAAADWVVDTETEDYFTQIMKRLLDTQP